MGYNTAVLILNDAWGEIERDPAGFVAGLRRAMAQAADRGQEKIQVDFRVGNHINGASVICSNHADFVNVIAVGGNHASVLLTKHNGGNHYKPDDREDLLTEALARLYSDLDPEDRIVSITMRLNEAAQKHRSES